MKLGQYIQVLQQYNTPHPNAINSYGATYGAHREFLEFNVNQHHELTVYFDEIWPDFE